MLHIILVILKIIGIVLAAILSLLLLALLAALFVPLRYRIRLRREGEEIYAGGKISYLFHFITVTADYSKNNPDFLIRILGIPLKPKKKSKEKKKRSTGKRRTKQTAQPLSIEEDMTEDVVIDSEGKDIPDIEETSIQDGAKAQTENGIENHKKEISIEEINRKVKRDKENTEIQQLPGKRKRRRKKQSIFVKFSKRIRQLINSIGKALDFIKGIPEKIKNMGNIIKRCFEQFSKYWSLIRSEEAIALFGTSKKELWYIIKHYKPKRAKGYIRFGTGDPASTGQILGAACLFFPIYSGKIQVIPDFDNFIYEGSIQFTGHIRGCHLVKSGWKIYRDKNLKKFLKRMKE